MCVSVALVNSSVALIHTLLTAGETGCTGTKRELSPSILPTKSARTQHTHTIMHGPHLINVALKPKYFHHMRKIELVCNNQLNHIRFLTTVNHLPYFQVAIGIAYWKKPKDFV